MKKEIKSKNKKFEFLMLLQRHVFSNFTSSYMLTNVERFWPLSSLILASFSAIYPLIMFVIASILILTMYKAAKGSLVAVADNDLILWPTYVAINLASDSDLRILWEDVDFIDLTAIPTLLEFRMSSINNQLFIDRSNFI